MTDQARVSIQIAPDAVVYLSDGEAGQGLTLIQPVPLTVDQLIEAGDGLKELGLLEAALEAYQKALSASPTDPMARQRIGEIENRMSSTADPMRVTSIRTAREATDYAKSAMQANKLPLATMLLSIANRLEPDSSRVLASVGALYRRLGDLDSAREILHSATSIDPGNMSAYTALGALERAAGNHTEAIRLYGEVLKDDPENGFALNGLGGVYWDLGKHSAAEDCFRQAANLPGEHNNATAAGLKKLLKHYQAEYDEQGVARVAKWLSALGCPQPDATTGLGSSDEILF